MKQFNKFIKFVASAAFIGTTMICLFAHADQTILVTNNNPNKLPPCPKPNYSKNNDKERFSGSHNCWAEKVLFSDGGRYNGEFRDGEKNGYGSYISTNGEKYDGEYINGKPNGWGIYIYSNGDKYTGNFKDNLFNGEGVLIKQNGVKLSGIWERDILKTKQDVNLPSALSQKLQPTQTVKPQLVRFYRYNPKNLSPCRGSTSDQKNWDNCWGQYVQNMTFYNMTGDFYGKFLRKFNCVGEFEKGIHTGSGECIAEYNWGYYKGEFISGIPHGWGESKIEVDSYIRESYSGEWKNGKPNGEGRLNVGYAEFSGNVFVDGKINGWGKKVSRGKTYEGELIDGRRSGFGIENDTTETGVKISEGIWHLDSFRGEEKRSELLTPLRQKISQYKFKKFAQPPAFDIESCEKYKEFEALQINFIWGKIDEISDSNSIRLCLTSEVSRLKRIAANFEEVASNSELKSTASIALQKSNYIKSNIDQLSGSTCLWKAVASLNESRVQNKQENVAALNAKGLGFFAIFSIDDSFIDIRNIFYNFFTDEYNTSAISKKINAALAEDTSSFKRRYFSTQDASVTAARNINAQNEREKASRNNRPVDQLSQKFFDSLLTDGALEAKISVPLRIEKIATGRCTADKNLNVVGD